MAGNHAFDSKFIKGHNKTGGTEGGACLNRHISGVTASSCSHRWQAWNRAKDSDSSWYEVYSEIQVKNLRTLPGWSRVSNGDDWSLTHGKNFQKKCRDPYHHNGHHILPNAVLNGCLEEASKDGGPQLKILVRAGLLKAKYNLNHKNNMIILPLNRRVGWALDLPIHLAKDARAHEEYSAAVRERVSTVIQEYANALKSGAKPEEHEPSPADFSRASLEDISEGMRDAIRAWGKKKPGAPVDDIERAVIGQYLP